MRHHTPLRQLADRALDGTLEDYVLGRRRDGQSWRQISSSLRDRTEIDIAPETLRLWFKQHEAAA